MIVIDNHPCLGVVEAIPTVITSFRNVSGRNLVGQLGAAGRLQSIADLCVESSVIAVTVFPVLLFILQAVRKRVLALATDVMMLMMMKVASVMKMIIMVIIMTKKMMIVSFIIGLTYGSKHICTSV